MTTCYFVSDLHGNKLKYELLIREITRNKPSFLFLGGDLLPHVRYSDKQKSNDVNPFIKEFLIPLFKNMQKQLGCNYPEVYLILGNDDYKADIPGFLEGVDRDLWKFLNSNNVRFGPYNIYGYSYVPPTPFRLKDWEKYDIDKTINAGSISPDEGFRSVPVEPDELPMIMDDLYALAGDNSMEKAIMLIHTPPYNSLLDQIHGGVSIGSKAVARFIEEKQPYITLHGHAHESSTLTGNWRQQFNRTHAFTAAYDGKGLALVIFQIDDPQKAERRIIE